MTSANTTTTAHTRAFGLLCVLGVTLLVVRTASFPPDPLVALASSGNDDILRLLSVRDWLAGQSWYDMRQANVVADGGLVLHWSRLVDVGIAAILWPASFLMPMARAEAAALLLWPLCLAAALVLVTARAAFTHFGIRAAAGAVLCVLMWQPMTVYFAPGRVDHHNVQILLLSIVVLALLRARSGARSGVTAGIATAVALAVGLETLLALGLAGFLLSVRALLRPDAYAPALMGYAATLGPVSALLFAAQTHPQDWVVRHCDELALPLLVPLLAVSVAAAALAWVFPRVSRLGHRTMMCGLLYGTVLLLGGPMLLECAQGPYGALPPAVEEAIYTQINEAKPIFAVIADKPSLLHMTVVPFGAVLLSASVIWYFDADKDRRAAAGSLLIFAWLAAIATLYQLRMIVLAAAVVPVLTGYVLSWGLGDRSRAGARARASSMAVVMGLGAMLYPSVWAKTQDAKTIVAPGIQHEKSTRASLAQTCRSHAALITLKDLPRGVVFSTLNLSPSILLTAGHPILAAPYHRSASALANGLLPFEQQEAEFRQSIRQMGAQYIVLCRNLHEKGFVRVLSQGENVSGYRLLSGFDPALVVYEVSK